MTPNELPAQPSTASEERAQGLDFVRALVAEDLASGKFGGRVITRFPPEPNGYLHIGHAKSITLNFGVAQENGGRCHVRFDDTNPETEDVSYVQSIEDDVRWLGFDWGEHLYFASDYFERMYEFAEHLIRAGKAYVDSSSEEEIRIGRGTVTQPGTASPNRDRTVEENLDLFRRMRAGEFPDGAHVLRGRIDMASPNMLMRDPLLYRIRHAHHYRTGDDWCIYPLYDYAHPLEDALECVTHSLCTLEFENNRELYDWVVENTPVPCRPYQTEFARLNIDYTVMSKRRLLELVNDGHVTGWDDPRMPTLAGMRRRGVTPEAIRAFCELVGVTRTNSRVDIDKLEYAIRDDLNQRVPRVLCVLNPLRVVITNYPPEQTDELDAPFYPHDVPLEGSRKLRFSRVLYIEREDFAEDPPKGYFRLAPGREVRLRYAYIIRCDDVVKDASGAVIELRCSYDANTRGGATPDGRSVKGTIHWVSAEHALPCEVRLYDRLFTVPDPDAEAGDVGNWKQFVNPESLVVLNDALIEPGVRNDAPGTLYQFERLGYFCSDVVDSSTARPVFNRTVTLRDTWARQVQAHDKPVKSEPSRKKVSKTEPADRKGRSKPGDVAPTGRRPEEAARLVRLTTNYGLTEKQAEWLVRDSATVQLFESTVQGGADARSAANWIINEVSRELQGRVASPLFGGADLASLIALVENGTITSTAGKEVLAEMIASGGEPGAIVERLGLLQVSDTAILEPLVAEVIAANPGKAQEYRGGRTGLLGYFVGQVMSRSGGRANPEVIKQLIARALG